MSDKTTSSFGGYVLSVLGWIGAICLFVLIRFVGLSSVPEFATLNYNSLNHSVLFGRAVAIGFVIGTIFYFISRAVDRPAIRQRPYGVLIFIQTFSTLIFVALVLVILSFMDVIIGDEAFQLSTLKSKLINVNFFVILIYYALVSFAFVLIKQINRRFGPGNLRKLVAGTYYHPLEKELIFMFLDLKDSTTHAERLGHLKFANLIQDCFIDMTVVSKFGAQFYQYVGDESILYWDVVEGIESANCLQAYFAFSHRLAERSNYYQARYGLVPHFKAGVNIGIATVVEVGEIKREIAYLGDVLNTAARIQDQCNVHGEGLLISVTLRDRLRSVPDYLDIDVIGKTELRGRADPVQLYRVRERPIAEAIRFNTS